MSTEGEETAPAPAEETEEESPKPGFRFNSYSAFQHSAFADLKI